jgi:hypothetical protein
MQTAKKDKSGLIASAQLPLNGSGIFPHQIVVTREDGGRQRRIHR